MNVQTKFRLGFFVLVLFSSSVSVIHAQTQVSCDSPPGGRIICERQQAAVCTVKEGQVYGQCSTPGRGMTPDDIRVWILSAIFGREVKVNEIRENPEYQRAVIQGRVEREGARFRFALPEQIDNPERGERSSPPKPTNSNKPPTPPDTRGPTNPSGQSKSPVILKPADRHQQVP